MLDEWDWGLDLLSPSGGLPDQRGPQEPQHQGSLIKHTPPSSNTLQVVFSPSDTFPSGPEVSAASVIERRRSRGNRRGQRDITQSQ
uniref:Uncharacterized protein n=1 Tax=Knipowitschia caucasica TaxID=637954 RepID=A0AAV2LAZ0_KNICA